MQEQEFTADNKTYNDIDTSAPEMSIPDYDYEDTVGPKIGYQQAKEMTQRKVAAARAEWEIKQRIAWRKQKARWLGFFGIFSNRR